MCLDGYLLARSETGQNILDRIGTCVCSTQCWGFIYGNLKVTCLDVCDQAICQLRRDRDSEVGTFGIASQFAYQVSESFFQLSVFRCCLCFGGCCTPGCAGLVWCLLFGFICYCSFVLLKLVVLH